MADVVSVSALLALSSLGIYFHSVFVSITLGFPIAIMGLLYRYSKTGEEFYLSSAKKMTAVLAVNFALGAITGTLVEFGLVQAWTGTIIAISSFAFLPLTFELIAFIWEIATLVLFIVTLGKISPAKSFVILFIYWVFAALSGVLITTVNSWLVAPWGTGAVPAAIYPFMPEFGDAVVDVQKLVLIKAILLASGEPLHVILQNPEVSSKLGIILSEPAVAFNTPYNLWSIVHNLTAAFIVGMSVALAGWMFAYSRRKDERYLSIAKSFFPVLLLLLLIQPTLFGHFMGEQVVNYNPTKFAMMENARESYSNPLVAIIAYGDPNHLIVGFDKFKADCDKHGNATVGDLLNSIGIAKNDIVSASKAVGVSIEAERLESTLRLKLRDVCIADLKKAEDRIAIVHAMYYTKIGGGILALAAVIAFASMLYRIPVLSSVVLRIMGERYFLISLLTAAGAVISSALGWAVREVGRKPWTVYGLLSPEELVNANSIVLSPVFISFMALVILVIGTGGIVAMIIVSRRFGVIK